VKTLVALATLVGFARANPARTGTDAVAPLAAVYWPIAELPDHHGKRACADLDKLTTAVAALPKHPPNDVPLDDSTWQNPARNLLLDLGSLQTGCKASDGKRHELGKTITIDDDWASLDGDIQIVLDLARARTLPPLLKQFRSLLADRSPCRQIAVIRKIVAGLADPPTGANTAKWSDRYTQLARTSDDLAYQCKQRDAEGDIAGDTAGLHDWFYELVVLLPPQTR
jgi:hypothetical protein